MAENLKMEPELKTGNYITWTVKNPDLNNRDAVSDSFECNGNECFLKLVFKKDYRYYILSMETKTGKQFSKSISMTAFLDGRNGPNCCLTKTVGKMPVSLLQFSMQELSERAENCNVDGMKFVIVFHEDVSPPEKTEKDESLEILSNDYYNYWKTSSNFSMHLQSKENWTVGVHKTFLMSRARAFYNLLEIDSGITRNLDFQTVEDLVTYLYSGRLPKITPDNAKTLYEAAKLCRVSSFQERCADFLIHFLTEDNACQTLLLADINEDPYLKDHVISFIVGRKLFLDEKWALFAEENRKLAIEVLTLYARKSW